MSTVDKIKERLSIIDVVSSYIRIEQSGNTYKARCPFHNEKTPSFFISPDRGGYYCFGCNVKGDIFTFVENFEGVDFKGALKILAERAGVAIEYENKQTDSKERLFMAMEEATKFFIANLQKEKDVLEYLKKRGLTDQSIENFKIGFVRNDWRLLHTYLREKKFTDTEIEKAGLVKKTDKGYYDRFRGRIMFPIMDSSGRVVAFTGRLFTDPNEPVPADDAEAQAKYLNSPETELFTKAKVLYGFDKAKFDIKRRDYAILVEGQMDLIMSHQDGFTNTVASSGTAITDSGLEILARLTNNLMIAFDKDRAGIEASRRASSMAALSRDMNVKVVVIPGGKDPADAILESSTLWKDAIAHARDIIDFEVEVITAATQQTQWMNEVKKRIFPYLSAMPSEMKIDYYISHSISPKTGLSTDAIRTDFNAHLKKEISNTQIVSPSSQSNTIRHDRVLKTLFGILELEKRKETPLIDPSMLASKIVQIVGEEKLQTLQTIPEDETQAIIFEAEQKYTTDVIGKAVEELLLNLEEEYAMNSFTEKQQALRIAENSHDQVLTEKLLHECQVLLNTINDIKKRRAN